MNVKFSQAILSLAIFLTLMIKDGYAEISCYSCNSFVNKTCDNPDPSMDGIIVKCPKGYDMCRKIEQSIYMDGDEVIRTHRQCAKTGGLGECLERTGTYKFKSWYCNCDNEDLCNVGTAVTSTVLGTGAALATVFFLRNLL